MGRVVGKVYPMEAAGAGGAASSGWEWDLPGNDRQPVR